MINAGRRYTELDEKDGWYTGPAQFFMTQSGGGIDKSIHPNQVPHKFAGLGQGHPERNSLSEIRREEACDPVTKFSGQAASVHVRQAERARLLDFGSDQIRQRRRQCAIVALHVELEVEPQAAGIPVGGTQECPELVDHHQFGVIERRR